jgi:hypothetical protein
LIFDVDDRADTRAIGAMLPECEIAFDVGWGRLIEKFYELADLILPDQSFLQTLQITQNSVS